jgi:ATP-dependent Clp protease, protease subunit
MSRDTSPFILEKIDEVALYKCKGYLDQDLEKSTPATIIYINSYGGSIYDGLGIIDMFKHHEKPIATVVVGKAMSVGALIASSGAPGMRYITENSTYMIHDVSSSSKGKVLDMAIDQKEVERLSNIVFSRLDKNSKHKNGFWKSQIIKNLNADIYITAQEGINLKLADCIGVPKMVLDMNWNLFLFEK